MLREWTAEGVLARAREYQPACVLLAAAELDVFGALRETPLTVSELSSAVRGDRRGTRILADALVALELLEKHGELYSPAPGTLELFLDTEPTSVVAMLRHQANCLRGWAQLAGVVRSGRRAERPPSVRGADLDQAAFVEAMQVASRDAAPHVVGALGPLSFEHLLDVGGGPGTWTIAFLRASPAAEATLFDYPEVIPIAAQHVEAAGLADRVHFVGGDFESDAVLPGGADLAWVSAIAHQNSRAENRKLFAKVHRALVPGGEIMIRDMVMDDSHTSPSAGALFAINMLVNTQGGGTYSFAELSADLHDAGFAQTQLVRGIRDMDSVVRATKS